MKITGLAVAVVAGLVGCGFVLGMEYASRGQRAVEDARESLLHVNDPAPPPPPSGYGPGRMFWGAR